MAEDQNKKVKAKKERKLEEPFPPKLTWWERAIVRGCYAVCAGLAVYIVLETCIMRTGIFFPGNRSPIYAAFSLILILLLVVRYMVQEINENRFRRHDVSKVQAIFVEAGTAAPRLKIDNVIRPEDFETRKKDLEEEVKRLKELGTPGWTEYQVLSLEQMLIDFLKLDDLIARARSRLTELGKYTEGMSIELYKRQYHIWTDRINEAVRAIEERRKEAGSEEQVLTLMRDTRAEKLRAETRELFGAVTGHEYNWALGSAIMRGLYIYGVQAIFILTAAGLLPLYYGEPEVFGLFNWGMLGIGGAMAAVLIGLRKSSYVEVGYTLGRKEVWRMTLGAGLGLIAGTVIYAMVAGGLLEGTLFPAPGEPGIANVGRSIFWSIAAGFGLEAIVEKLRGAAGNA
jgi:hypothetical protein